MSDTNGEIRPALEELDGPVRKAVEHIRNDPAPPEAVSRAVDRASLLNARLPMPGTNNTGWVPVPVAVAAGIFVAISLGVLANLGSYQNSNAKSSRGLELPSRDRMAQNADNGNGDVRSTIMSPFGFANADDEHGVDPDLSSKKNTFGSITDGTSNTIMIREKFIGADEEKPTDWMPPDIYNRPAGPDGDNKGQDAISLGGRLGGRRVYPAADLVVPIPGKGGMGFGGLGSGGSFSGGFGGQFNGGGSFSGGGSFGGGGSWGFRPGPSVQPPVGPLNNGSLQPGFIFGVPPKDAKFGTGQPIAQSTSGGREKQASNGVHFINGFDTGAYGDPGREEADGKGKYGPPVLSKLPYVNRLRATSDEEARSKNLLAKDLAAKWQNLSEADRNKGLADLTRDLTANDKETVTNYFNSLSDAVRGPVVWHRDRQRPSFARVYVGAGNSLELVSLQVSVTVEGPRARTIVDHIFHNPHNRQLEGTFEYPLPTGASASYFAMFLGQTRTNLPARFAAHGQPPALPAEALAGLSPDQMAHQVSTADWGQLQEARVVGREKALETYEDIVRVRIDPALLEYSGGNTFSARVFPIPAAGYNRVIIAYEELLPVGGERALYRFPLPDCKLSEVQFTLQADQAECKEARLVTPAPTSYGPLPQGERGESRGGGRVVYTQTWKEKGPGGEAIFAFRQGHADIQAISGRQGESGPLYVYARLRPKLKVESARPFADHAVFLLDTSLSEHPDRFAISMMLWQKILENDPAIKKFNILAFNVGASWIEPKGWLDNTKEGRGKALSRLDGIVLEGATDISAALEKLSQPLAGLTRHAPLNAFLLSDAQITWGEADVNSLVSKFEERCPYLTRFHCYRFGLGADNLELFESLTRKGGGIFNCYSEMDLASAARAHQNHCLQVERVRFQGGPPMSDVLIAGRKAAVYPGGELIVTGRASEPGRTKVIVEGNFLGERVVQEFPVEITAGSELAARGWGEVAVASLLALNDPKLDSLVTAYCQQFGVGSRVASFLVLENPNDYKRLNLEEERGKVVPGGDLEKFLDDSWRSFVKAIKPKEAFEEFLKRAKPASGSLVTKLLRKLTDKDFEIPQGKIGEAITKKADVPPGYLATREADLGNVHAYLDEAKRRAKGKDPDGAIRVLSSVVELFPTRADALRLVGYRLLDLHQPEQAVRLFQQVEKSRPFEPHSYRDLARSLEESGRYGLAAMQYEILLAGQWHNRFRDSLKEVALEEYARMMQDALRKKAVGRDVAEFFGDRLEGLASLRQQADLRVTISWNTDATDVDLWVIEPDGTKCFYSHNRTKNGGELSQDQTQGYGPERYQVQTALPGVYTVIVHYFAANANLLAGESHVNVVVAKHAGMPDEEVTRHTVILQRANEQVEVCKVKVK